VHAAATAAAIIIDKILFMCSPFREYLLNDNICLTPAEYPAGEPFSV